MEVNEVLNLNESAENIVDSGEIDSIVSEIYKEFPVLSNKNFKVKKVSDKHPQGHHIEFFSSDEERSPYKGQPYIEIYENASADRNVLKKMIFGDMLHQLSIDDPHWKNLKNQFFKVRSPEAKNRDLRIDMDAYKGSGDTRKFEDWWDISRSDAYIRGALTGDREWMMGIEEGQGIILNNMMDYLLSGTKK